MEVETSSSHVSARNNESAWKLRTQTAEVTLGSSRRNAERRKREHLERFKIVHKCLTILVHEDFVGFAIISDSFAREVANLYVNKAVGNEVWVADAFTHIRELVGKYPKGNNEEKGPDNLEELLQKLTGLLDENTKLDENDLAVDDDRFTAVEHAVDDRLAILTKDKEASPPDIHSLMMFLDSMCPVSV